jgi:uncharacterized protein (TIGR00730 family)
MEKIGVFCASSNEMEQKFYDKAAELGRMLGKAGKTLVYGGNSSGLMEAVAKATKEAGGKVFGVVPRKLVEAGRVSDCVDITFYCEDLNDRKQWLIGESDVMIVLPGSAGTLDEAFSAIASNTFGMHQKKVIFWNIDGFYNKLFEFLDEIVGRGVVNKPWNEVMERVTTVEEIEKIVKSEK